MLLMSSGEDLALLVAVCVCVTLVSGCACQHERDPDREREGWRGERESVREGGMSCLPNHSARP